MTPVNYTCRIHEDRIQKLEDKSVEQAGSHARIESQFKVITEDIGDLKKLVLEGFSEIKEECNKLTSTIATHQNYIDVERIQKENIAKVADKRKKYVGFVLLPLTGAVLAGFGEMILDFFKRMF